MTIKLDIGPMSSYIGLEDDQDPFTQTTTMEQIHFDLDSAINALDKDYGDLIGEEESLLGMEADDRTFGQKVWSVMKGLFMIVMGVFAAVGSFLASVGEWIVKRAVGNKSKIKSWEEHKDIVAEMVSLIKNGADYDKSHAFKATGMRARKDGKLKDAIFDANDATDKTVKLLEGELKTNDEKGKAYEAFSNATDKMASSKDTDSIISNTVIATDIINKVITDKKYIESSSKYSKKKDLIDDLKKLPYLESFKRSHDLTFVITEVPLMLKALGKNLPDINKLTDRITKEMQDDLKLMASAKLKQMKLSKKLEKIYTSKSLSTGGNVTLSDLTKANKPLSDLNKMMKDYSISLSNLSTVGLSAMSLHVSESLSTTRTLEKILQKYGKAV